MCLILAGFMFLFGAGEEISWGQRIFNIETPEFFKKHNAQKEMNLHNLVISSSMWTGKEKKILSEPPPVKKKGIKINKLIFGLFLGLCIIFYFLILPFLYRKKKKIRDIVDSFALPMPKIIYIYAYLLLVILSKLAVKRGGELLEFGGCWIILLMMLYPYNTDIFSKKTNKKLEP